MIQHGMRCCRRGFWREGGRSSRLFCDLVATDAHQSRAGMEVKQTASLRKLVALSSPTSPSKTRGTDLTIATMDPDPSTDVAELVQQWKYSSTSAALPHLSAIVR